MLVLSKTEYHKDFLRFGQIIKQLKPLYDNGTLEKIHLNSLLRQFMGTLPNASNINNWTGKISKEALNVYSTQDKFNINCEHEYPKQIIIPLLFTDYYEQAIDPVELEILYFSTFGNFNLVTQQENLRLITHQHPDRFTTPEESYKRAKIELVDCSSCRDILFTNTKPWFKHPLIENIKLINYDRTIS